jgi:hypothetical protein
LPGLRTATAITSLPTSIPAHRSYRTRMPRLLRAPPIGRARGPQSPGKNEEADARARGATGESTRRAGAPAPI